ncbi:MAG: aminoacyl-tRNA hydrolase [Pseudomonadota bacterium]
MRLFVGLGNPGAKYARNRHNAGFMALDRIAADHGFEPWRSRFQGEITEGRLGGGKVMLIKPGSFMNRSGQPVGEAARYFDIAPEDITVFQDELDLAPGKVRVKRGGGHAGHNGLRSLHAHLGPDYRRVRIGIGHPGHKDRVSGYVLSDFAKAEIALIDDVMRGISDGADALAAGDDGRFMNAVALRVAPPRASTGTAPDRSSGDRPRAAPPVEKERPAAAKPAPAVPEPATDRRSPLQRLADRFR